MTDQPTTTEPVTWAESVASTGTGPTATIEIEIHVPGHTVPIPVEVRLDQARELHDMLGGVLAEHDAPGRPVPAHQLARALGQPEGMTLETLIACARDVVADRARISREWELLVREGNRERAAHEEHRRWLASLFDLPSGADWLTVARGVTEARQLAENMQGRAAAMETRADTAEAKLARVRKLANTRATNGWSDVGLERLLADLGDDQPTEQQQDATPDAIYNLVTYIIERQWADAPRTTDQIHADIEPLIAAIRAEPLRGPIEDITELPLELDGATLWQAIRDHAADDHAFWTRLTRVRHGIAAHAPQDRQP